MKTIHQFFITSFDGETIYAENHQNSLRPKTHFVFIHGLGGDSNFSLKTVDALLETVPNIVCTVHDLRGHGFSSKKFPSQCDSIEYVQALDLKAICDYFESKHPIIIGHSLGGIVLQTYINKNLEPQPLYAIFLCTPLKTFIPLSIRSFWYSLLVKSKNNSVKVKKRSLQFHLRYKNTFDFHPIRVFFDFYYTGFFKLLVMYLSILGWNDSNPKKLNPATTLFIYGKNDMVCSLAKMSHELSKFPQLKCLVLPVNHHQALTATPVKLANAIKQLVVTSTATQLTL